MSADLPTRLEGAAAGSLSDTQILMRAARQTAIEDLVDAVHEVPLSPHKLELVKAVLRSAIAIMNAHPAAHAEQREG